MTARRLHEEELANPDWFVPSNGHLPEVLARLRLGSATVALTTKSGDTWVGIGQQIGAADKAITLRGWGAPEQSFPLADLVTARNVSGFIPRSIQTPIVSRQARGEPAHRSQPNSMHD